MRVGVLALQGAFREHEEALTLLGATVRQVRLPRHLEGLDALVIPGGESTTMGRLMEAFKLRAPLCEFALHRPVLGTCAGLIMLARRTTEGEQPLLGVLDVTVRRNAFGRQVQSFEGEVELHLPGLGSERWFPGVFIRAPWVEETGPGVEEIAFYAGRVVGVRQGVVMAVSFHPELTKDTRIHSFFLRQVNQGREAMVASTTS